MIVENSSQRKSELHLTKTNLYRWSVLMVVDSFGTGHIAQPTAENRSAMNDGWVLVTDGLRLDEACVLRDNLKDETFAHEFGAVQA